LNDEKFIGEPTNGPSGIASIASSDFTKTDISIAVSEVIKLFVRSYFLRAGDAVMGIHGIVTAGSSPELTATAEDTGKTREDTGTVHLSCESLRSMLYGFFQ